MTIQKTKRKHIILFLFFCCRCRCRFACLLVVDYCTVLVKSVSCFVVSQLERMCVCEREREENEWRRLESIQRTVCDFVCCCEYLVSMLQSSVALVAVLQCIKLPVKCKMISSQILCRRIVAGISKNDPRLKRVDDTSIKKTKICYT